MNFIRENGPNKRKMIFIKSRGIMKAVIDVVKWVTLLKTAQQFQKTNLRKNIIKMYPKKRDISSIRDLMRGGIGILKLTLEKFNRV